MSCITVVQKEPETSLSEASLMVTTTHTDDGLPTTYKFFLTKEELERLHREAAAANTGKDRPER